MERVKNNFVRIAMLKLVQYVDGLGRMLIYKITKILIDIIGTFS